MEAFFTFLFFLSLLLYAMFFLYREVSVFVSVPKAVDDSVGFKWSLSNTICLLSAMAITWYQQSLPPLWMKARLHNQQKKSRVLLSSTVDSGSFPTGRKNWSWKKEQSNYGKAVSPVLLRLCCRELLSHARASVWTKQMQNLNVICIFVINLCVCVCVFYRCCTVHCSTKWSCFS